MTKKPSLSLVSTAGGFGPSVDIKQLAEADLARSGISLAEAKQLGITYLTGPEAAALGAHYALPCLKIPYFEPNGSALSYRPKWPQFFRLRYLIEPPKDENGRAPRYFQPKDSGTCAYFPKSTGLDWAAVIQDPDVDLIITEGEKKAAAAAIHGFYTVGLGGVFNFTSKESGFLAELEQINWVKRKVIIAHDSDVTENKNIVAAVNRIAAELHDRGALPRFLVFAPNGDEKVGLDDFLLSNTPEKLEEILEAAEPILLAEPLWKLNEKFVFIRSINRVAEISTGLFKNSAEFKELDVSKYYQREAKLGGSVTMKKVSAAGAWLDWQLRFDAHEPVYEPEHEPRSITPDNNYNTWVGWAVPPTAGDASYFVKLVDHLFTDAEPGVKEWFLQWLAYPFQHPGTKLASAVLIHSREQGTGKSLLFLSVGRIYGIGTNFIEVGQDDFHAPFNEWAANKQFVLGDDVTSVKRTDKQEDLDRIKKLITQKNVQINKKYLQAYSIRDTINYAFTSNHADAIFLEDKDRRFFVHNAAAAPMSSEFYAGYDAWLNKDGPSIIFDYLLKVDLTGFNPMGHAMNTESKQKMRGEGHSELGTWVGDLAENADELLKTGEMRHKQDLFTVGELKAIFCEYADIPVERVSASAVSRELTKAGYGKVHGNKPICVKGRKLDRYYAIRNADRWLKETNLATLQTAIQNPAMVAEVKKRRKF